jgi:hypothetical protein
MPGHRHQVVLLLLGLAILPRALAAPTGVCGGERIEIPGSSWSAIDGATGQPIRDLRQIAHEAYAIEEAADGAVTASLTPLQLADSGPSTSRSMSFFFHRAGHYVVRATDGSGEDVRLQFQVSLPSAEITRMTQTKANLYRWKGRPMIELGSADEAGLEFDVDIDMGNCGGTIGDVQTLAFTDMESVREGLVQRYATAGETVVDFVPKVNSSWHYGFRGPKNAGDRLSQVYRDSPKVYLADNMLCVSSEADFHYYVLYRSEAADSAWVPVAQLDWHLWMYARRPDKQTPWIGGSGVEHGGQATVAGVFEPGISPWPAWSEGWRDVGMVEVAGDCDGG